MSPVRLLMRASILGPISSRSWKAKTQSGHPARASVLCEPPLPVGDDPDDENDNEEGIETLASSNVAVCTNSTSDMPYTPPKEIHPDADSSPVLRGTARAFCTIPFANDQPESPFQITFTLARKPKSRYPSCWLITAMHTALHRPNTS